MIRPFRSRTVAAVLVLALSGCSLKRAVVNRIGDGLAGGPSVFETDDDPRLVGEALPFSIKLTEMLLAESPRHRGLLLAACKATAIYAYLFVEQDAQMNPALTLAERKDATVRAHALYLRALEHGLRGL